MCTCVRRCAGIIWNTLLYAWVSPQNSESESLPPLLHHIMLQLCVIHRASTVYYAHSTYPQLTHTHMYAHTHTHLAPSPSSAPFGRSCHERHVFKQSMFFSFAKERDAELDWVIAQRPPAPSKENDTILCPLYPCPANQVRGKYVY